MRARRVLAVRVVPLLAAVLVVAGATVFADRVVNPALLFLSGTVKIGIHGGLPGWSYPRDEPEGFDVALARFLAEEYGFTLELVPLQPEQRESELRGGRVDLVIANYSIDGSSWSDPGRSRLDVIDFVGPYFLDKSGVMYSSDKLGDQQAIPVDNVCVSNLSLLTTYTREFGATARPAVWRDDPSNYPVHDERYGIAMADDSPALCRELTDAVDEFLTDHEHGWDRAFADHLHGVADRARHKPERADTSLC